MGNPKNQNNRENTLLWGDNQSELGITSEEIQYIKED